jgi:hypothetical protein
VACAQQCATCAVSQSNCTSCSSLNGAAVFLQNGTCSPGCANGTYPQSSTSNNTCLACNAVCLTCFGPLSTNCDSCGNSTTSILFKDPSGPTCRPSCPQGYVGISSSNSCQQCDAGCASCQNATNDCQQCQKVGNIFYYLYDSSCLMLCPDGTYKNGSSLSCLNCSYFTLNQECIQQCPTGYVGISKLGASVCEGCSTANCSTYDKPFTIQTTVDASSDSFIHQIGLPNGLSQSCTAESVGDGLQVQLLIKNGRLLTAPILLSVLSVSISSDYRTVTIATNSQPVDISTTSIGITFRVGALVTPSGVLYNSLSSSLDL